MKFAESSKVLSILALLLFLHCVNAAPSSDYLSIARNISNTARGVSNSESLRSGVGDKFFGKSPGTDEALEPASKNETNDAEFVQLLTNFESPFDFQKIEEKGCYDLFRSDITPKYFPQDIQWVEIDTIGTEVVFGQIVPVANPFFFYGKKFEKSTLVAVALGYICIDSPTTDCIPDLNPPVGAMGTFGIGIFQIVAPFLGDLTTLPNYGCDTQSHIYFYQDQEKFIFEWQNIGEVPWQPPISSSLAEEEFDPPFMFTFQLQFFYTGEIFYLYQEVGCFSPRMGVVQVSVQNDELITAIPDRVYLASTHSPPLPPKY